MKRPPRIGIGGPVGSGKTMLCLRLCQKLRERYSMAVVTNDIYCSEDAQFLIKHSALAPERIAGVETGGCPHTAIRDDTTMNEQAWIIWLPTANVKLPLSNRFGNLQPSPIPHRLLWNIDRVFVKARR